MNTSPSGVVSPTSVERPGSMERVERMGHPNDDLGQPASAGKVSSVVQGSNGLPDFQDLFLSMLEEQGANMTNMVNQSTTTTTSSHSPTNLSPSKNSDLALALAQHIRMHKMHPAKSNASTPLKRKMPSDQDGLIVLIDDDSNHGGTNAFTKRRRLDDDTKEAHHHPPAQAIADVFTNDDQFINDFYDNELGTMKTALDELLVGDEEVHLHSAQVTQNNTADIQQALDRQKNFLLEWFSELLTQFDHTIQKVFQENVNELHAKVLGLEQYAHKLETNNKEITERLRKMEVDEIDKTRIQKAQRDYLPTRRRVRELLLQAVGKNNRQEYAECTELLSEEIKQFGNFSNAVEDQLLLLQCRHFNERAADRATILDLEARLEAAEEQAMQTMEKQQSNAAGDCSNENRRASKIAELEASLEVARNASTEAQQQAIMIKDLEQRLVACNQESLRLRENEGKLTLENYWLKTGRDQLLLEKQKLGQQLQEVAYLKQRAELRVSSLMSQLEVTRMSSQIWQNVNNPGPAASFQQRDQLVPLVAKTAYPTELGQKQCDRLLQEREDKHEGEMKSLVEGHMGLMKGQAHRMEQMASVIKELSAINRKNEETISAMTLTINRLSRGNAYQLE